MAHKQASNVSIMELYSPKTAYEQLFQEGILALQRPLLQKCNLNSYIVANLTYDRERSESSMSDLLSGIAHASGVVQKGEKIVDRGEIVTDKTYRILESFKKENERRNEDVRQNHLSLIGKMPLSSSSPSLRHSLYATRLSTCTSCLMPWSPSSSESSWTPARPL